MKRLAGPILVAVALLAAQTATIVPPAVGAGLRGPLTALSLRLSTYAASASEVSYSLDFTTSATGALAANSGTIDVEAPTGTFPPAPACANAITVTDLTGSSSTTASMCFYEVGTEGNHLVIPSPVGIDAGNRVEVLIPGLDNPAGVGLHAVALGTSADRSASVNFQILKAGSLGGLSVSRSDDGPGASQVTYTIGFTTSATGALAENTGTITIEAPVGTFPAPPQCGDPIVVTDLSTKDSDQTGSICSSEVGSKGSRLVVSAPVSIRGTDRVDVVIPELNNPATAGSHTLTVRTSSDGTAAVGYNTAAPPHAVVGLSLALSTLAARATEVTYTVEFTTSATGALDATSGAITLHAAPQTFPAAPPCGRAVVTVTNLTTKASGQVDLCSAEQATVSEGGAQLQLLTAVPIGAGQRAQLEMTGLDNPKVPGPAVLLLSTSSDGLSSVGYTITGEGIPLAALSLTLSTAAARATRVTYTLGFTTSASGGLAADWGVIEVEAPPGTFPTTRPCGQDVATITDLGTKAAGEVDLCSATVTNAGADLELSTPVAIGAGQSALMAVTGLDNPAAAGPDALALSTTSNSARSVQYRIVPGSAVADVSLVSSNDAAGADGVTDAVAFSAPLTGALAAGSGTIMLRAAPGTFLPATDCSRTGATVTDTTTRASAPTGSCFGDPSIPGASSFGIVVPVPIGAGDKVVLTVSGLANPASVGPQTMLVTTSSNGVPAHTPFSTVAGGPLSGHVGDTSGNVVAGAEVEACPSQSGQCYDALSSPTGNFSETVPYGRYAVSAFPPQGASLAQSTGSEVVAPVSTRSGTNGVEVTLRVLQPLPAGLSVAGQDGGVPTFYSGSSAPMTVRGCRHGAGAVVLQGTSTATGGEVTFLRALVESPPGSGRYTASLPPLWPVHGDISIRYHIYCPEGIAPTAGLAAGGTVVTLHGRGLTGATSVDFGATPAISFKVMSDSFIEAVAPPGSGTVAISVKTPRGVLRAGPLTRYTYISLASVTPSHGPASGSAVVVIRGVNVGQINTLWFGDRMATNLKVISNNEISALTPPGSGDEPVTIGQITYAVPGEEPSKSPKPSLLFQYGPGTGAVQGGALSILPTDAGRASGLSVGGKGRSADGDPGGEVPTSDPFPLDQGGTAKPASPGGTGAGGWGINSPARGIGVLATELVLYGVLTANPFLASVGLVTLGVAIVANALADPSGTISNTNGGPISGATVVLEQGPTAEGPFRPAAAASPGIEPHLNPEKTGANGEFHWDVISDFYKVVASAPDCHAPGEPTQTTVSTPVLPVPPPRFGLDLVLRCRDEAPPARPKITSLSPYLVATRGGSQVDVVGTGFMPGAKVFFGPTSSPAVTYVSADLLEVTVPPGHGNIRLVVITAGGRTVANAADELNYVPFPAISRLVPASGPVAGGTRVTIKGAGLLPTDLVRVGNVPVTNFTVEANGDLEITVPPGRPSSVDIRVTTPLGTSTLTPRDRFTYTKAVVRQAGGALNPGGQRIRQYAGDATA